MIYNFDKRPHIILMHATCMMLLLLTFSESCFAADYVVKMKRKSGVYAIPCVVNGVKRDFIFDTGAANTSLSQEFVKELLNKKRLLQTDFTGAIQTRNASGVVDNNTTINIRELRVGNRVLHNVRAIIAVAQKAPLLLGLNAIELLGDWSIRKQRFILHDNTPEPLANQPNPAITDVVIEDVELVEQPSWQEQSPTLPDGSPRPSLQVLAYKGDAQAQYMLGMKYLTDESDIAIKSKGVYWLHLSAEQDYKLAQLQLAECYSKGIGVEVNEEISEYWRNRAEQEEVDE